MKTIATRFLCSGWLMLGALLSLAGLVAGCKVVDRSALRSKERASPAEALNPFAESYVRLVLALGEHDGDTVDAYYGPATWREEAKSEKKPLGTIRREAFREIARRRSGYVGVRRIVARHGLRASPESRT